MRGVLLINILVLFIINVTAHSPIYRTEEEKRLTRKKLALKRDPRRGQWAIRKNVEEDHHNHVDIEDQTLDIHEPSNVKVVPHNHSRNIPRRKLHSHEVKVYRNNEIDNLALIRRKAILKKLKKNSVYSKVIRKQPPVKTTNELDEQQTSKSRNKMKDGSKILEAKNKEIEKRKEGRQSTTVAPVSLTRNMIKLLNNPERKSDGFPPIVIPKETTTKQSFEADKKKSTEKTLSSLANRRIVPGEFLNQLSFGDQASSFYQRGGQREQERTMKNVNTFSYEENSGVYNNAGLKIQNNLSRIQNIFSTQRQKYSDHIHSVTNNQHNLPISINNLDTTDFTKFDAQFGGAVPIFSSVNFELDGIRRRIKESTSQPKRPILSNQVLPAVGSRSRSSYSFTVTF